MGRHILLIYSLLFLLTFIRYSYATTTYYEIGVGTFPYTWYLSREYPSLGTCENTTIRIEPNSTVNLTFRKQVPEGANGILINEKINFSGYFRGYGINVSFGLYKEKEGIINEICKTTETKISSSDVIQINSTCNVEAYWVEANYTLVERIYAFNPTSSQKQFTHYFGSDSCLSKVDVPETPLGFLKVNLTYPTTPQNWINGSTYNITCSMICDGGSCIFVYPYAVYAPNITNWYIIGSESDPYKNILLGPGEKNPKELITIVPPNIIKSINLTLLANKPSTNLIACNGTSIYSDSPTSASSKVQITILPLDTEAPIIYPDANATPTISNSAIKLNQTVKDNVNVSLVYFTINSVNYSTNRNGDEFYRIGICAESKEYNWTDTWANDTSGNMNHSIIGLKFICDVNAPLINLISPENSTITTSQNLNFTFIATDDMFTKFTCNIFLDLGLNQTNVSVVNNTLTTFTINGISIGNHTWYIKCRDTAGNLRESEKRTFSIIIPPATCGDGICDNGETSLNCPKDCCNESVIESDANCCSFYNYTWISGYGCCGNSIEEGVCGSYCYNKNTKKCCLDGYYLCFLSECCSNYTCYSQGTCKDQMVCKSGSWEFNCTICPCPTNRICVNNVCVEKKCSELYCCSDADCPEVCNAGYLVKRYCPTIGGVCAERSRTNCPYGCIITSCYTTKQNLNIFVQMDKDVYEKNELMRIAGNVFYSDNKTNNFSVIITFKNGNWSISKKLNTTQDGRFDYQYWISFSDPEGMWEIKVDATDNFGNAGSWSSMKEVVLSSTSIYNVTFLVPEIEQNFKRGEMINITVNVTTNYLPVSGANATATLFIYGQEKIGVPLLEIENGIYNGNYTINYNDALGFWMISVQVIKNEGGKTFGGGNFTRIVVLPANIILQLLSPEKDIVKYEEKFKIVVKLSYENGEVVSNANVSVFSPQGIIPLIEQEGGIYATEYTTKEIGNFTLSFNALDMYENHGTKVIVIKAQETMKGFLEKYFYFFVIGLLVTTIFYRSILIRLPFYKEKRTLLEIKKFEEEIKKLKDLKIKTEAQYYKGMIDEKSFENMMRKYQEDIVERENKIRILNEKLEKIRAEKTKK